MPFSSRIVLLHLFVVLGVATLHSQELAVTETAVGETSSEPGCLSPKVSVITDRPTASSSTDTTQCGVLEVLSGPERMWLGHGVHQDDIAPSLQFGLTPRLDLHYARGTYIHLGSNPGPLLGVGDTFVGARYRISKQTKFVPSFGAFYTLKVPTASVAQGLGTGRYDHSLAVLASKDVPQVHIDFNVQPGLTGRAGAPGFDTNTGMMLYGYHPLLHNLTLGLGGYGFTALNDATPGYAMAASALDWQVSPKLMLDVGFDEGVTTAAPRKRLTFGFTFAPGNLYAMIAGPQERPH